MEVTFSPEFYHKITLYLTTTFELVKTEKTNIKIYALRAQHAIDVYKEIMKMYFFFYCTLTLCNFPVQARLSVQVKHTRGQEMLPGFLSADLRTRGVSGASLYGPSPPHSRVSHQKDATGFGCWCPLFPVHHGTSGRAGRVDKSTQGQTSAASQEAGGTE